MAKLAIIELSAAQKKANAIKQASVKVDTWLRRVEDAKADLADAQTRLKHGHDLLAKANAMPGG